MPETIIDSVLTGKLDPVLLMKWLNNESIEDIPEDCVLLCSNRCEFVAYFLAYLRRQTDSILRTNSSALQVLQHSTPEKLLSSRKHQRSISDPTYEADRSNDSLSVKPDRSGHTSPSKEKKRTGRRVKTKLFSEDKSRESVSSDESRLSSGVDRSALSSTPMKNGLHLSEYPNLMSPVTPSPHSKSYERCDTPRLSHRHSRSQEKTCLGDYIVTAQKSSKKKKSTKNVSDDSEIKSDLDLSNSDVFPEIGARKSSSLKSEKRRIKPTNIDRSQKSLSLNSFNSECFHQSSPSALEDNAMFKHQKLQPKELSNSFDVERNILKQERHKLMEKFNILNTTASPKATITPQINITRKDSLEKSQNYVKAESSKVTYKEKLDVLVEIYDALLRNNLVLSMSTEISFLVSVLLSKQYEDDYLETERKLDNNVSKYLLKIIHNSTYFAVKSLWYQRGILEVVLDKNSLKLLGENKKVRSFYPELAKFLLNSYGLKCEAESNQECSGGPEARASNGVICFNLETDNADNFPSLMSFQNFKKQRDMFYEILRWYNDTQASGVSRTTLKARIKALVWCGNSAANLAHLAALLVRHMLAHCVPPAAGSGNCSGSQESKLSKLHRRLTRPAPPATAAAPPAPGARAPHFAPHEMFYKEVVTCAESGGLRAHARDALAAELCALHHAPLPNTDVSREYLLLSKKLCLLGKFLGFTVSLPYWHTPEAGVKAGGGREQYHPPATGSGAGAGGRDTHYAPPKEKVLENNVALRNYSQPCIDLRGMLSDAVHHGRLCLTVPWLVQYLSMVDYTGLRLHYYQDILRSLLEIYGRLRVGEGLKKNTVIFLKSTLGWLFALPHFPQELFYEQSYTAGAGAGEWSVDSADLITEATLLDLCPHLREVNVLLATCRVSQDQREPGSFRHITPVSLTLNPEERMRSKEKELQSRLEEEFLKSQPASTRRVLEVVTERVCAHALRETARALPTAQDRARARAADVLRKQRHKADHPALLRLVVGVYTEELSVLRAGALEAGARGVSARCSHALAALLPHAPRPLHALAAARCKARLAKWLNDNWNTTAVLCKDIEGEMKTLLTLGELGGGGGGGGGALRAPHTPLPLSGGGADPAAMMVSAEEFHRTHVSTAEALINIKEQICLVVDGAPTPALAGALVACARACSPRNVFCRPPARQAILQLSIDLCLVFVSRRPKEVTEGFLQQLHCIWDVCCPDRERCRPPPSPLEPPDRRGGPSPEHRDLRADERPAASLTDDGGKDSEPKPDRNQNTSEMATKKGSNLRIVISNVAHAPSVVRTPTTPGEVVNEDSGDAELFERVLCPRNIALLGGAGGAGGAGATWDALALLLVFLLRHRYLSEDCLTEQCLAVYRQDWPQSTLERLSACMRSVSTRWSSAGRFTLFLDFLAEYCGDMDPGC